LRFPKADSEDVADGFTKIQNQPPPLRNFYWTVEGFSDAFPGREVLNHLLFNNDYQDLTGQEHPWTPVAREMRQFADPDHELKRLGGLAPDLTSAVGWKTLKTRSAQSQSMAVVDGGDWGSQGSVDSSAVMPRRKPKSSERTVKLFKEKKVETFELGYADYYGGSGFPFLHAYRDRNWHLAREKQLICDSEQMKSPFGQPLTSESSSYAPLTHSVRPVPSRARGTCNRALTISRRPAPADTGSRADGSPREIVRKFHGLESARKSRVALSSDPLLSMPERALLRTEHYKFTQGFYSRP